MRATINRKASRVIFSMDTGRPVVVMRSGLKKSLFVDMFVCSVFLLKHRESMSFGFASGNLKPQGCRAVMIKTTYETFVQGFSYGPLAYTICKIGAHRTDLARIKGAHNKDNAMYYDTVHSI